MKIAVPTNGELLDSHFAKCENYTLFTIDAKKQIIMSQNLKTDGGLRDITNVLTQAGVDVLLAGTMGDKAYEMLTESGLKVYRNCSGKVEEVLDRYISNI